MRPERTPIAGALSIARRSALWLQTARYLRPIQVASRLRLRVKQRIRSLVPSLAEHVLTFVTAHSDLQPPSEPWRRQPGRPVNSLCSDREWNRSIDRAEGLRTGRFTFLNVSADLGQPIDWKADQYSQLWRYHLHYGDYLLDAAAVSADAWSSTESLMRDWVSACPIGRVRDPWHPFVVSERLVNWLFAIQLREPATSPVPAIVWRSLSQQAVFVDRNLERDVGGNHLLKNYKALAVASCVFRGATANRWRKKYVEAFAGELASQLLPDGSHYERSPMYHSLVLSDAIDIVFALRLSGASVPDTLARSIRRMVRHLPVVTHPDGGLALFNDSVLDEAPPPSELIAAAKIALGEANSGVLAMRHALLATALESGYSVEQSDVVEPMRPDESEIVRIPLPGARGVLLVDTGRACPDDLPAHAHADFFSFELSLDERRMIVDAGVGEYARGAWRDYYRSTRAHNTVAIDGIDQIECWDSFRVGRRASVLGRAAIDAPGLKGITASHDGYKRLADPVTVGRTVVALDDIAWLVVDELTSRSTHAWESYLHAAPETDISLVSRSQAVVTGGDRRLTIAWFGVESVNTIRGQTSPKQGWHAPSFGCHVPVWTLVLAGRSRGSTLCGYVIAPGFDAEDVSVDEGSRGIRVRLGSRRYLIEGSGVAMHMTADRAA